MFGLYDSIERRALAADSEELIAHYNRGRPHSSLGPGIPEPVGTDVERQKQRHRIPDDHRVTKTPILCGLHHEYRLEKVGA
jgi:hypothetical protein